jgi:hypothetical protein
MASTLKAPISIEVSELLRTLRLRLTAVAEPADVPRHIEETRPEARQLVYPVVVTGADARHVIDDMESWECKHELHAYLRESARSFQVEYSPDSANRLFV